MTWKNSGKKPILDFAEKAFVWHNDRQIDGPRWESRSKNSPYEWLMTKPAGNGTYVCLTLVCSL